MDELNRSDLIDYISKLLNLEISGKLIYLDVSEALDGVSDIGMFRNELKLRVANLNDDYKYLNGFQKFTKIMSDYNKKQLALNPKELDYVVMFCDRLYGKLTEIFEIVRFDKIPTKDQLLNIDLDHCIGGDGNLYFEEREIKVYNKIGDVVELYRLSTQNKPLLKNKIESIVNELIVQKKKVKLQIGSSNQKYLS
jgi:hypothetical protein